MVVYKGKLILFGGFYDASKETKCVKRLRGRSHKRHTTPAAGALPCGTLTPMLSLRAQIL